LLSMLASWAKAAGPKLIITRISEEMRTQLVTRAEPSMVRKDIEYLLRAGISFVMGKRQPFYIHFAC